MTPAMLYVRRPIGDIRFLAEEWSTSDGRVHATGRQKFPSGRLGKLQTFSWPQNRVLEIQQEGKP